MEPIHKRTQTTEKGPDGRIRKSFSPPAGDVKLWRETVERDDGEDQEIAKIRVPVSSTGTDRDGDRFSRDGLEHMVEQFKSGEVPMFPNHGLDPETGWNEYRFEHKMGGWKDAEIEEEGGTEVAYAIGALSPDSEEAEKLASQIENGVVPVTFSVGFMPLNADTRTNEDGEPVGREFHEHDLFETSPVGIPANSDATVSAMAEVAAKGVATADGITDPDTIQSIAKEIEATVKAGGSFEHGLKQHMDKEPENAIPLVEAYLDAEGTSGDDTLEEFLGWVEDSDGDIGAAEDAVEAYLDNSSAEEPADATIADLGEWLVEEYAEEDGDGEEEQNSPERLSSEEHREIVRDELQPIQNEISELRDAIEALGAEEADSDVEENEISELREELEEIRSTNEELRERLEEPTDPKGKRGGITPAADPDEENNGSTGGSGQIESTPRDGGNSRSNGGGDLDRLAEHLANGEN